MTDEIDVFETNREIRYTYCVFRASESGAVRGVLYWCFDCPYSCTEEIEMRYHQSHHKFSWKRLFKRRVERPMPQQPNWGEIEKDKAMAHLASELRELAKENDRFE